MKGEEKKKKKKKRAKRDKRGRTREAAALRPAFPAIGASLPLIGQSCISRLFRTIVPPRRLSAVLAKSSPLRTLRNDITRHDQ